MGTPVGVWLVVGSLFFFGTIGVTAGCGSGSSGGGGNGGLDTDCPTACNKVAAACGGSVDECVSSCEDTSSFPSSCLSEAEDLTNCAATTEITASCMTNDDTFVSTQLALPCASVSNCDGQLTCSASC